MATTRVVYNLGVPALPVLVLAAVCAAAPPPHQAVPAAPLQAEFRVFDGTVEVTSSTRLRIRTSGAADGGRTVDAGDGPFDLTPGIYDVQAVRQDAGQVVSVRWAERLVIMPYPDEGGRHLEVINFTDGFGAMQLRWADGQAPDPAGTSVTVSNAGERDPIPSPALRGLGYLLLVLRAGTYDVRVIEDGHAQVTLTGVDVPADRTRVKAIQ